MELKLRPAQLRFFHFLTKKRAGEIVTEAEILEETRWKPITLRTYERKHYVDPFISLVGTRRYRVLRDGESISQAEVASSFTQVRPGLLVLTRGKRLVGESNEYELQRYLGEGAVAHVWEARCSADSRGYAVKVLNPRRDLLEPRALENVRKRFTREARNGMKLKHDGVVRYCDFGEISGHPFLVMDLADESLYQTLKQGPLSLTASLPIILSCLAGLDFLHESGCVHRDVKPQNVLRMSNRYVLGDLGIVRWSDMNTAFTTAGAITRSSLQLGSWYYMAPEQRDSPHSASHKSDVYSLGVMWYEVLTGNVLDPAAVAAKRFAPPSTNGDAAGLIQRMLEFDPAGRPSVKELLTAVSTLGNPTSVR